MSKPRYKKGKPLRRTDFKSQKPVILIVCEGKKTEPNYLTSIKQEWRLTSMDIEIVGGDECGTDPKGIVDFAKSRARQLRTNKREIKNENVWCVFDRDQHLTCDAAIIMANDNGFGVAFSNPCIELWYLLHFQDQTAYLERDAAKRELKNHMPDYEKSMAGIFRELESGLIGAELRANNLRIRHVGNGYPENHNPSTSVDKLIKHLRNIREADTTENGCS
ncbi:MAG: RloB family protein [bacterium]